MKLKTIKAIKLLNLILFRYSYTSQLNIRRFFHIWTPRLDVWMARNPDEQKSRLSEVQMARCPDGQMSGWPEVQMAKRTVGQKDRWPKGQFVWKADILMTIWFISGIPIKQIPKYWCSLGDPGDPSNDPPAQEYIGTEHWVWWFPKYYHFCRREKLIKH